MKGPGRVIGPPSHHVPPAPPGCADSSASNTSTAATRLNSSACSHAAAGRRYRALRRWRPTGASPSADRAVHSAARPAAAAERDRPRLAPRAGRLVIASWFRSLQIPRLLAPVGAPLAFVGPRLCGRQTRRQFGPRG